MNKTARMRELIDLLKEASRAYYAEDREIMSNYAYDALYDELVALEEETGMTMADSPTVSVGYEAADSLEKVTHEQPMLSLDKTKDRAVMQSFVGDQPSLLSWKLDGLTIVLTYEKGELFRAVTRGNGIVGEDVTANARVFANIPLRIPYQGSLILRGEALITYEDFERINAAIAEVDARYKNPRNLCSGSVRQLNNRITRERNVRFYAFGLVAAQGVDFRDSHREELEWLRSQGFDVVEYAMVTADNLYAVMDDFAGRIENNPFPSDGLVITYDGISYGRSLGNTAKFPRNAMAFKWADEVRETTLLSVEWSPSRTGLINPVAIFEPVELEGTTVSRASLHNISIMEELELGLGDRLLVYKANMIIPQISENLTRSGMMEIPEKCPACGGATMVSQQKDARTLYCTNPDCPAKAIKAFDQFVSRDALNIDGLSEATLEKFIARGFLHSFTELFSLSRYREEIIAIEGYGERAFEKLADNIEKARKTTLPRLLYGLGIPNVGLSNAKLISRYYSYDPQRVAMASREEIASIEGLGDVIAGSMVDWFADPVHRQTYEGLLACLVIEKPEISAEEGTLAGKTFVITGAVNHFPNRSALKERIEALGGKVAGSVSSKTDYLINNDAASGSSKNKKAKELGVAIITEEEFLQMIGEEIQE